MNELDLKLNSNSDVLRCFNNIPDRIKQMFLVDMGFYRWAGFTFGECKSPIEEIFYAAFDVYQANELKSFAYIEPQVEIMANGKKYFADFVFDPEVQFDEYYLKAKKKVVIECDGHDFHQKTKKQVIKDNEREYDLKMAGYDVIRFSGSEIYNTPYTCAEKAINYISTLI